MRHLFLASAILFASETPAQTDITFTVSGLDTGEVYLGYHLADQKLVEDTLEVEEGGVVRMFSSEGYRPGLYFLYQPSSFYWDFVINEPSFSIASNGSGYENFEVSGSRENEVFKQFRLEMDRLEKTRVGITDSIQGSTEADSVALMQQFMRVTQKTGESIKEMVQQNPDLMISKMIALTLSVEFDTYEDVEDEGERRRLVYRSYRDNFRKKLDFDEPGLLRTPIFKTHVIRYLNEVVPPIPDTVKREVDEILTQVKDDSAAFRYWLGTFTDEYQKRTVMWMEPVWVHLMKKYYLTGTADWITDETLDKMRKEVAFLTPNQIGNQAPALNLTDTTLAPFRPLTDLREDYLVLYFYDPDCGHCRKTTPLLLDAYYDLKDLNAEVVAVCTITDLKKWKDYIKKNDLDWVNLADPYVQSRFRTEYDIRSTPRVYVLDKDRKILAKRISIEQLVPFLTDHKALVMAKAN